MTTHLETGKANREQVRVMLAAGVPVTKIALALDLTRQRVYQIKRILEAIEADQKEHAG